MIFCSLPRCVLSSFMCRETLSVIDVHITKLYVKIPGSGLLWCRDTMEHSWSHLNSQGHRTPFRRRENGQKSVIVSQIWYVASWRCLYIH